MPLKADYCKEDVISFSIESVKARDFMKSIAVSVIDTLKGLFDFLIPAD